MAEDSGDRFPEGGGKAGYEVGYGKPPQSTRFRPGQSGNPRGRRKDRRNFKTYLHEELETKVTVTKDGRQRTMMKVQLIATQLVNTAVKGDLKSIEYLMRLLDLMNPSGDVAQGDKMLTEEQRRMLMTLFPLIDTEHDKNGKDGGNADSQ